MRTLDGLQALAGRALRDPLSGLGALARRCARRPPTGGVSAVAAGRRRGARILLYHRVLPEVDDDLLRMQVSCRRFEEQLAWLAAHCSVVSLDALARQLREGASVDGQVVITFDDGYRDNRHYAAELLRHYRLPATFFLTAGWIGTQRRFWWDEVAARLRGAEARYGVPLAHAVWNACTALRALPAAERARRIAELGPEPPAPNACDLPMSWAEARELAALGFSIGAHTLTHPALSGLDPAEARTEIEGSRRMLEEQLGTQIRHFCYPYDEAIRWGRRVPRPCARLVAGAGFETAATVIRGAVFRRADPLALPRLAVQNESLERFVGEL